MQLCIYLYTHIHAHTEAHTHCLSIPNFPPLPACSSTRGSDVRARLVMQLAAAGAAASQQMPHCVESNSAGSLCPSKPHIYKTLYKVFRDFCLSYFHIHYCGCSKNLKGVWFVNSCLGSTQSPEHTHNPKTSISKTLSILKPSSSKPPNLKP